MTNVFEQENTEAQAGRELKTIEDREVVEYLNDWAKKYGANLEQLGNIDSLDKIEQVIANGFQEVKKTPESQQYEGWRKKGLPPIHALYMVNWDIPMDEWQFTDEELFQGSVPRNPKYCLGRLVVASGMLMNDPDISEEEKRGLRYAEVLEDGFAKFLIDRIKSGEIDPSLSVYDELVMYEFPHTCLAIPSKDDPKQLNQFDPINSVLIKQDAEPIEHPEIEPFPLTKGIAANSLSMYGSAFIKDPAIKTKFLKFIFEDVGEKRFPAVAGVYSGCLLNEDVDLEDPQLKELYAVMNKRKSLEYSLIEAQLWPEKREEVAKRLVERYGKMVEKFIELRYPALNIY